MTPIGQPCACEPMTWLYFVSVQGSNRSIELYSKYPIDNKTRILWTTRIELHHLTLRIEDNILATENIYFFTSIATPLLPAPALSSALASTMSPRRQVRDASCIKHQATGIYQLIPSRRCPASPRVPQRTDARTQSPDCSMLLTS
jgi:hypothetical protein